MSTSPVRVVLRGAVSYGVGAGRGGAYGRGRHGRVRRSRPAAVGGGTDATYAVVEGGLNFRTAQGSSAPLGPQEPQGPRVVVEVQGPPGAQPPPDAARLVTSVEKVENTEGIEEARAGRLRQDREAGGDAEVLGGGEPRRGDLRFHSMDCGLVRAMTPVPKPRAITSVAGAIPVR